jgi:hypothetical protein
LAKWIKNQISLSETTKLFLVLVLISLAGCIFKILYIYFWEWHQELHGDAFYFHWQASMLVSGKGLSDPFAYFNTYSGRSPKPFFYPNAGIQIKPGAFHPVLFSLLLALFDLVDLKSVGAQLLAYAVICSFSTLIAGWLGFRLRGKRAAILIAVILAAYPGIWMFSGQLLAEPLAQLVIAFSIYAFYKIICTASIRWCIAAAISIALCALTRSEYILLILVALYIIIAAVKNESLRYKFKMLLVIWVVALGVISPWAIRNLIVFKYPEVLSADFGNALAVSNCDSTYYENSIGYANFTCSVQLSPKADESYYDHLNLTKGFDYIKSHLGRAFEVAGIRVMRVLYLYSPYQQAANFQHNIEQWPLGASELEWFSSYAINIIAVLGFIKAKKYFCISPLLGVIIISLFATMISYGDIRFLAPANIAICIISGIGLDLLIPKFVPQKSQKALRSVAPD